MLNLKHKKHQAYYGKHFPGIDPDALTKLTRELFAHYQGQCKVYGFSVPSEWTSDSMKEYLKWRMTHTTLGLESDPANRHGLATERTLLRWVQLRVRGMASLKIPFGLVDYNSIKNQVASGQNPWDMLKVTAT